MYKKFEKLLEQKGITAYQVARDTGLATSTFYNWKAGRYEPKIDKLKTIAEYLGVPVTYFIE